jgi:predicted AAA+ superfamily ATPase
MLIHKGLSESLAGRFELIRVTHWDYSEMKKSFGYSLEDWFFFGGYPGSAPLKDDLSRWKNYIRDSIIEPTIAQDILQMERVDKPALLRRLFELASTHSSKVLSFQKILGQLQDAGNATTLAHYLKLLDHAGMLSGLEKYSGSIVRKKASSPKLQVQDNALLSALEFEDPVTLSGSPEKWGKWVESGIGVHLLNAAPKNQVSVEYWLHRGFEVDFVLSKGARLAAFEVKSGRRKTKFSGLKEFKKHYPSAKTYVVGTDGIPLETFVTSSLLDWRNPQA